MTDNQIGIWEEVESFSIEELGNIIANDNPDRGYVAALEILQRAEREKWPGWERMRRKLSSVGIVISEVGQYADQHAEEVRN